MLVSVIYLQMVCGKLQGTLKLILESVKRGQKARVSILLVGAWDGEKVQRESGAPSYDSRACKPLTEQSVEKKLCIDNGSLPVGQGQRQECEQGEEREEGEEQQGQKPQAQEKLELEQKNHYLHEEDDMFAEISVEEIISRKANSRENAQRVSGAVDGELSDDVEGYLGIKKIVAL